MHDPLRQLLRIVGGVALAIRQQGVIEQAGQPLRVGDAIGHLPPNRDGPKIRGRFLENKGRVSALNRDRHEGRGGRIIEER